MKEHYDIIGDIHGHADRLVALLEKLGYERHDGVFAHPSRKVIFLGDFIDRGPAIRQTLEIVRPMIDDGKALAVMGNHEFNAIAYATPKRSGEGYLRERNPVHADQHKETLHAFATDTGAWEDHLAWFRSLPFYLDLGTIRVVHACWDDGHMQTLKEAHDVRLDENLLHDSHDRSRPEYILMDEVLKGKEHRLPDGVSFFDKERNERRKARIRWWKPAQGLHYTDYLIGPGPGHEIDISHLEDPGYPADAPPVFFGHYWMSEQKPSLMAPNAACVDYSVAMGGFLCAYRWDGETTLSEDRFVTA